MTNLGAGRGGRPGARFQVDAGQPGAPGDPRLLLGVLEPGEALTVDENGQPAALPVGAGGELKPLANNTNLNTLQTASSYSITAPNTHPNAPSSDSATLEVLVGSGITSQRFTSVFTGAIWTRYYGGSSWSAWVMPAAGAEALTAWAPSTAYKKGQIVTYQGVAYIRKADGTSGASFNGAQWDALPQSTPTTSASDLTSGTLPVDRLPTIPIGKVASGTPGAGVFVRGDGVLAPAPALAEWAAGVSVAAGDVRKRDGIILTAISAHTTADPFDPAKWKRATAGELRHRPRVPMRKRVELAMSGGTTDTAVKLPGKANSRRTTVTGAFTNLGTAFSIPATNFTGKNLLLWLRRDETADPVLTSMSAFDIAVSSDNFATTSATMHVTTQDEGDNPLHRPGVWTPFEVPARVGTDQPADARVYNSSLFITESGKSTPNWSAITHIKVGGSGKDPQARAFRQWSIYCGGVEAIDKPSEAVLSVMFDRFTPEMHDLVAPILAKHGITASFRGHVYGIGLNDAQFMTLDQLRRMHDEYGHEIAPYDYPSGFISGIGNFAAQGTGTTTSGSPTVTGLATTTQFTVGQVVASLYDTAIPVGTTILSKTSTTLTLSANATASGSKTIMQAGAEGVGSYTTGSNQITGVTNAALFQVGQIVRAPYQPGIPKGTKITAVSGTTITMSANATVDGTSAVIASPSAEFAMRPKQTVIDELTLTKSRLQEWDMADNTDQVAGQIRKLYDDAFDDVVLQQAHYATLPSAKDHPGYWPSLNPRHQPARMYIRADDGRTRGNLTSGSNVITNVTAYASGFTVGQAITGTGIPNGTTVTNVNGTDVTISANATATASNVVIGPNFARFKQAIDRMVTNKEWGRLLFHGVSDTETDGFIISPAELDSLLTYAVSTGVKFRSVGQVLDGRV